MLSAVLAVALDFDLVFGGLKIVAGGQVVDEAFERVGVYGDDAFAGEACQVVVMFGEGVAELDFVLPADVDTVHGADLLQNRDGAIDAGAVDVAGGFFGQLAHGHRLLSNQHIKQQLPRFGKAVAV